MENLLKFPNLEVSAVFSKIEEQDPILKEIPFYTDYKKMISEIDFNALIIGTPTDTHGEIACYCAEQGNDIFIEKPMVNTLESCDKILQAVEKNNVKMLIGHVLRFWPTYGSVQKSITDKSLKLGEIEFIQGKRIGSFPWSKWFAVQKKSGGVILDLSIHDIDYALWILGKPISVSCSAKKFKKYNLDVFCESTVKINFEKNKKKE
jgi:predicted dehydrogenase